MRKNRKNFILNRQKAAELARMKLHHYNQFYNFTFKRITIRDQKSRWGSCSRNGNLSFNYRIALLPEKLGDYIIVHELCHLGQFNHSRDFWNLVAQTMSDWRVLRKELRKIKFVV